MRWSTKTYQEAITAWVIVQLHERKIKHAPFSRLMNWDNDGRTFRLMKKGKRRWSFDDIIKLSEIFNEPPSYLLAKVELLYKTVIESKNI